MRARGLCISTRFSAPGVALVLVFCLAQSPRTQDAGQELVDAAKLEKDLRKAMATAQFEEAKELAEKLVATGDPKAIQAVIDLTLTGANYEVDKHVGGLLAASTDPNARAVVLENLSSKKSSKYKTKIILLAVAKAVADDPKALSAIHGALKDPNRVVVMTALQALRDLKKAASVEPLIAALEEREKKTRDRVYHDMIATLRHITGTELQASIDFKNFWLGHEAGQKVAPHPGGGVTSVSRTPSFFTVSVNSDRVLFVIDVSSSMTIRDPEDVVQKPEEKKKEADPKGTTGVAPKKKVVPKDKPAPPPASRERLARVKEELVRVINSLEPGTRFGILSFSHELSWWGAAKSIRDASPSNKADAVKWVRALVANGATRTDLAMAEAMSVQEIDTLYLLTDGAPRDETNKDLPIEPIIAQVKEQNRFLRCRIHTVSFAQIKDKEMKAFVRQIAAQNDGVCTMLP